MSLLVVVVEFFSRLIFLVSNSCLHLSVCRVK
uniref:Uncharacterized protein n=1 Tax=Arundo donax TaxID=35708 RepID=A0A0A9FUH4_ARUDO